MDYFHCSIPLQPKHPLFLFIIFEPITSTEYYNTEKNVTDYKNRCKKKKKIIILKMQCCVTPRPLPFFSTPLNSTISEKSKKKRFIGSAFANNIGKPVSAHSHFRKIRNTTISVFAKTAKTFSFSTDSLFAEFQKIS